MAEYTENDHGFYRITVADYGDGIPDDRKNFLFRKIDELDSESAAEGHGLGLSVVSALAERYGEGYGWTIGKSEDFTKGSVFSLIIPRVV